MLCSKCIEAFFHILALQLCLSSALQHWIDVGEGLLHKVHDFMPDSFPHIHDPTVLGIELHVHPESTCQYFETLPADAHGMHQNMIHNNMFVFKKGVQTV